MNDWLYKTELAIRRAMPEQLKLVVRAARLLKAPPPSAPTLPQAQLDGCIVLSDRNAMLGHVMKNGVLCELGVLHGAFALQMLAQTQPRELHLVDVTFAGCDPVVLSHSSVRTHQMMTTGFLNACPDGMFDFIYVDADHSYPAVCADIQAAKNKVKPGGLLAFNDFARILRPGLGQFGVHQAVCEFMVDEGWPLAFFCMQGEALYDVALRRPSAV